MIKGIDVSESNGVINWDLVKESGIRYAIIRIGYGGNYESQDDKQAVRNMQECERLGIPYGAYLYSYGLTIEDATDEAEHLLRMVKYFNPSLGCYFDMEDADGYKVRNGLIPEENGQLLTDMCNAFMNRVSDAGYHTGTYASQNYFENILKLDQLSHSKWIASWGVENCPVEWADIWQYTSDGEVQGNGISRMDMDYFINEDLYNTLVEKSVAGIGQSVNKPVAEEPIENNCKYSIGDVVRYNRIYSTSGDWTDGNIPYFTEGTITNIYPGSRHPYLIGEGTGFIDDNCIVEESVQVEEPQPIEERYGIVSAGGSFWQVASDYLGDGNRFLELAEYNGMPLNTTLYEGMQLRLPN